MTAAEHDISTPWQEGKTAPYPVKGGVQLYDNTMICLDANGYAVPASDTAGLKFVGVSQCGVDARFLADGERTVQVTKGYEHDFESSGAALDQTHIGEKVFIVDDKTVALSTSESILAGRLQEVLTGVVKNARVWIIPITRLAS